MPNHDHLPPIKVLPTTKAALKIFHTIRNDLKYKIGDNPDQKDFFENQDSTGRPDVLYLSWIHIAIPIGSSNSSIDVWHADVSVLKSSS